MSHNSLPQRAIGAIPLRLLAKFRPAPTVVQVSPSGGYAILDVGIAGHKYALAKRKMQPAGLLSGSSGAMVAQQPANSGYAWDVYHVSSAATSQTGLSQTRELFNFLP